LRLPFRRADSTHRLGRGSEEMAAIRKLLISDQPQIGLVHQRSRIECLARLFLGQLRRGKFAQFVVDEWQQLRRRLRIASIDRRQDASHVGHVGPA
jgi:hypothetical protein